jgi:hypothetical protein
VPLASSTDDCDDDIGWISILLTKESTDFVVVVAAAGAAVGCENSTLKA